MGNRALNGQSFVATRARCGPGARHEPPSPAQSLGELGPLPEQVRLGGFWIPQRGLFGFGQAYFH